MTVGTSLLRNYDKFSGSIDRTIFFSKYHKDNIVGEFLTKYEDDILSFIEDNKNNIYKGAELRSFNTFIDSKDAKVNKVVLLPTDTADSYICSKIIEKFLINRSFKCRTRVIENLTYAEPGKFESQGLKNLVKIIKQEVKTICDEKDVPIINGTPGFKAETAIMLFMAQLLKVDIFYMHERMEDSVIVFPHLPIILDNNEINYWKPLIKVVYETNNSDDGILPYSQFQEYLNAYDGDLSQIEFLFEIEEEFGGVSLSVIGMMIAETLDLDIQDVELLDSDVSKDKRLKLNESEMPHAPAGTRNFAGKLSEFPFCERVKTIRYVNTSESRIKVKYDRQNPGEIQILHSDGKKGIDISMQTTAKDEAQNYLAKSIISDEMNLYFKTDNMQKKTLYKPGELMKREHEKQLESYGVLEKRAEKIIADAEQIITPYEEKLYKNKKTIKALRQEIQEKQSDNKSLTSKIDELNERISELELENDETDQLTTQNDIK